MADSGALRCRQGPQFSPASLRRGRSGAREALSSESGRFHKRSRKRWRATPPSRSDELAPLARLPLTHTARHRGATTVPAAPCIPAATPSRSPSRRPAASAVRAANCPLHLRARARLSRGAAADPAALAAQTNKMTVRRTYREQMNEHLARGMATQTHTEVVAQRPAAARKKNSDSAELGRRKGKDTSINSLVVRNKSHRAGGARPALGDLDEAPHPLDCRCCVGWSCGYTGAQAPRRAFRQARKSESEPTSAPMVAAEAKDACSPSS